LIFNHAFDAPDRGELPETYILIASDELIISWQI